MDAAGVLRSYSVTVRNEDDTANQYTLSYTQEYRLGETYLATVLAMDRTGDVGPLDNTSRRYYDLNGNLVAISDDGESNNNREFVLNAEGQILASRKTNASQDESRYFFVNGQNVGRLTLDRSPQSWDADHVAGFAFNVDEGVVGGDSGSTTL